MCRIWRKGVGGEKRTEINLGQGLFCLPPPLGEASRLGRTCAELGKHLHGVVEPLLAKQVEAIQILDVINLPFLIVIGVILHLLAEGRNKKIHSTENGT